MKIRCLLLSLISLATVPAMAAWRTTTPAAEVAVRIPRIAAVLEAATRFDKAILEKNEEQFASMFADDAVVNNPFNRIASKQDAIRNLKTGLIDYRSLERFVEYAAVRGPHDVVLMGEEAVTPVGKARFANRHVRRRTTEVWSDVTGTWQLSLRQATIYVVD